MAERIVSPGVFTREKDLSFLPQGIGEIGAAIIGPTQKGPAFTPTIINNFSEFEEIFGTLDSRFYVPYTAKQYLKSAGTVTIVRVLGIGGYQASVIALKTTGSTAATDSAEANPEAFGKTLAILAPTRLGGLTGFNVKDLANALTGAPLTASLFLLNLISNSPPCVKGPSSGVASTFKSLILKKPRILSRF